MFKLGKILVTSGAFNAMQEAGQCPLDFLKRHIRGDWGDDMSKSDRRSNDSALMSGQDRILSAYKTSSGKKLWIITEADRKSTTLLLPDEY